MNKNLMIVIAALLVIFGLVMSGYNNLVGMNENINGKWSQIENQLQRRNDLIPNLVNTVKGYAAHESDVFKAVADARAKLGGAKTVQEASQANANFTQLQDELAGTENRIAVSRQDYNNAVQEFNASIKQFPTVLYAGILGFSQRDYFEVPESAKAVPQVQF